MPKTVPNASSSYSQLPPTWYNLKQPLKPNISKYMLKNDEKTKKYASASSLRFKNFVILFST